jgi:hypothetical protein
MFVSSDDAFSIGTLYISGHSHCETSFEELYYIIITVVCLSAPFDMKKTMKIIVNV